LAIFRKTLQLLGERD